MTAAATGLEATTPEPLALVRAIRRMKKAGFEIRAIGGRLQVAPADTLTTLQREYLREHKAALVQLLTDAETLTGLLEQAGSAGLGWREGTPEWDDGYLLAVGEVLYSTGRMVSRWGRHYAAAFSPPMPRFHDAPPAPEIEPAAEVAA